MTSAPRYSDLTVDDAAESVGVTRSAIYQAIREGRLRATRRSRALFIERADLDTYRAESRKLTPKVATREDRRNGSRRRQSAGEPAARPGEAAGTAPKRGEKRRKK